MRAAIFIDRYAEINEYLIQESQRKEDERLAKIKEERRQQRLFLDEQVRLQRDKAEREKRDEQKFVDFERGRRERWNDVDRQKRAEMKERESAQRIARDAQIEEVARRKAQQKLLADQADRETLARIRQELSAERVEKLTRRMEEADNMRSVVEQNERNLRLAAEHRHKRFLEGQKVGIEYKKILDQQERDREERLASTYSRMAKQAVHANFLHDQIATEGAKDEARARARQEADAAARDAELEARDERRRALQRETNAILEVQVAERKKAGIKFRREDKALVELEARAAAEAVAKERDEVSRRKAFDAEYRRQLAEQIRTDKVRKQMIGYTLPKAEVEMNAELLRKIDAAKLDDKRSTRRDAPKLVSPPRMPGT